MATVLQARNAQLLADDMASPCMGVTSPHDTLWRWEAPRGRRQHTIQDVTLLWN